MEATGISHIAVCVRDMDKSLVFYRDILGMKISKDEIEDTSTGGLTHTYKHHRNTRRTAYMQARHTTTPLRDRERAPPTHQVTSSSEHRAQNHGFYVAVIRNDCQGATRHPGHGRRRIQGRNYMLNHLR